MSISPSPGIANYAFILSALKAGHFDPALLAIFAHPTQHYTAGNVPDLLASDVASALQLFELEGGHR